MTLASNFHNQNFCQVLTSVKTHTGILALRNLAQEARLCLHVNNCRIQAVFLNGRPVRSSEEARSLLMQQFSDPISDFRFEQALPEDLRKGLDISMDHLLEDAPASAQANPTGPGLVSKMLQRFGLKNDPG